MFTREARQRTERAFGVPVREVYAATETAGIASQCEQGSFHLYEDLVIAEVVDAENRPVPAGEFGEKLLVTVLFSRTQPLIRYELADRVQLRDGACPCGRPFALLSAIEGRTDDALVFAAVQGGTVRIHPFVLHDAMESISVRAWQIVGERGRLRVLLAQPAGDFHTDSVQARLSAALTEHGALPPPITFEFVDSIPRTPAGKASLIVRKSDSVPTNGEPR